MSYLVQTGQTIAAITRELGVSFQALKAANPRAVGRTADGRWFFKAGAVLEVPQDFNQALAQAAAEPPRPPRPDPPPAKDSSGPPPPESWWTGLKEKLSLETPLPNPKAAYPPPPQLRDLAREYPSGHTELLRLNLQASPGVNLSLSLSGPSGAGADQTGPARGWAEQAVIVGFQIRF